MKSEDYKDYISIETAFKGKDYLVFDTETSLIGRKSIFCDVPEFICGVTYRGGGGGYGEWLDAKEIYRYIFLSSRNPNTVIVGHNLAFDLNTIGYPYNMDNKHKAIYWDTAIFEYELTGQAATYPSLQQLADKYCPGESKESVVSEMIKSGVEPKDIPIDLLLEYCGKDVEITQKIFLKQLDRFFTLPINRANLILERFKYRMNTYYMSVNGMTLDSNLIEKGIADLSDRMSIVQAEIVTIMAAVLSDVPLVDINPNSLNQLSTVLYGGAVKYETYVETGDVYKTGPKAGTKKVKKEVRIQEVSQLNSLDVADCMGMAVVKKGTTEEDLKYNQRHLIKDSLSEEFISNLLEYRTLNKELNTYFVGYRDAGKHRLSPGLGPVDTISIHTEYKHTGTPTGRISSTKPNIQNLKSD